MGNITYKLKRMPLLGCVLIIFQAILLILASTWIVGEKYDSQWNNWFADSPRIYLTNINQKNNDEILSNLDELASKEKFMLIKQENSTTSTKNLINVGVMGQTFEKVELDFLGHKIIDNRDMHNLIISSKKTPTLGNGSGSINQIKQLPSFLFASNTTVYRMKDLVKKSGTLNGEYKIIGVHSTNRLDKIIKRISKITGIKKSNLLTITQGGITTSSIYSIIFLVSMIVSLITITAYFIVRVIKNLRVTGTLVLLGWSKVDVLIKMFTPFILMEVITIIPIALICTLIFGQKYFYLRYFEIYILVCLLNILLVAGTFLLASLGIFILKNIDLIRRRFPKKFIYSLTITMYFVLSGVTVASLSYIDGPMKSIVDDAKQLRQWHHVADYYILNNVEVGQDGNYMYDPSSEFNHNMYDFYKAIENKKGVYLIHSFHASKDWLNSVNKDYKTVPTKPFWLITISPNYAKKIGIFISKTNLNSLNVGKRLYLIPKKLSKDEKSKLQRFLKEDSLNGVSKGDIQTNFVKNKKFKFIEYQSSKSYFTWNNTTSENVTAKSPVFEIVTSNNMTYVDIGNLSATGINGNLKFKDKRIFSKIVDSNKLVRYRLADNKLKFVSVQNYIDGDQKRLENTIKLFLVVVILLVMLEIFDLIVIANIYKTVNREKIYVKKFLGYPFFEIYKLPLVIIVVVNIIQLLSTIVLRSKIGILLILLSFIIQLIIFKFYISHDELDKVIILFKGE